MKWIQAIKKEHQNVITRAQNLHKFRLLLHFIPLFGKYTGFSQLKKVKELSMVINQKLSMIHY